MKSRHFVSCLFVIKVKASWDDNAQVKLSVDYLHKSIYFTRKGSISLPMVYRDKFTSCGSGKILTHAYAPKYERTDTSSHLDVRHVIDRHFK
jgi:hypothetical protein